MGLLCLIIVVVILVSILDHGDEEISEHHPLCSVVCGWSLECDCAKLERYYEEREEEEEDPALAGDRIRILIEFPHDKE